jgi:hypothetical protein
VFEKKTCSCMGFLKSSRTYFHLTFLHRSVVVLPLEPSYSNRRSLPCPEVETIEVGVVTRFIPPSTLPGHSAVPAAPLIIISVVGRELHSVVICQRITSITLDIKHRNTCVLYHHILNTKHSMAHVLLCLLTFFTSLYDQRRTGGKS